MDNGNAQRLTALFRHQTASENLDTSDIWIGMEIATGDVLHVNVKTPMRCARYLRFMTDNQNPLFRWTIADNMPDGFANPIIFRAMGRYRDLFDNKDFAAISVRLRFSNKETSSELCFNEDFRLGDYQDPHTRYPGPSLNDFIKTLERAGGAWSKVTFVETPLTLLKQPHLKLVKS